MRTAVHARIDQAIHAIFLRHIADSDPNALHVVIADQAGFHLREDESDHEVRPAREG